MTELSPEARAILDAGRDALSPSAATKAEVFEAVQANAGAGGSAVGASGGGISSMKLLMILLVAAGISTAVWLYLGGSGGDSDKAPIAAVALAPEEASSEESAEVATPEESSPDDESAEAEAAAAAEAAALAEREAAEAAEAAALAEREAAEAALRRFNGRHETCQSKRNCGDDCEFLLSKQQFASPFGSVGSIVAVCSRGL